MDKKLKALFDFQKFQCNKKLSELISDTNDSFTFELSDKELFNVSAAGESYFPKNEDKCHDT